MTEQRQPNPRASPQSRHGARHRRSSLYRRVLSLGAAAIIAATLPFSVMYVDAVNRQPKPAITVSAQHPGSGTTRVVTTASGAIRVLPASNAPSANTAAAPAPLTTRVS